MDTCRNIGLVGTGSSHRTGIDRTRGGERSKHSSCARIRPFAPAQAPIEIGLAGLEQLAEALRTAQRIGTFEQRDDGRRPQVGRSPAPCVDQRRCWRSRRFSRGLSFAGSFGFSRGLSPRGPSWRCWSAGTPLRRAMI